MLDEGYSYEIYKSHPHEAFTFPDFSDEIIAALQAEQYRAIPIRLKLKNYQLSYRMSRTKSKNKGRKRKERGTDYKKATEPVLSTNSRDTINFIRSVLPEGVIQKESGEDIYVLCPFHDEKTASMALHARTNRAKCFGCGKAFILATFFSITLGGSKLYRSKKLREISQPITESQRPHKNQLTLPFPEERDGGVG